MVTDPVDSAKGIGSGVKRFGVNLGRMTKRAVDSAGNDTKPAGDGDGAAEGAANSVLGVSSAMRRWARKVGADPYTTNPVLREALKEIGQIDAAGSDRDEGDPADSSNRNHRRGRGRSGVGQGSRGTAQDQRADAEDARRAIGRCGNGSSRTAATRWRRRPGWRGARRVKVPGSPITSPPPPARRAGARRCSSSKARSCCSVCTPRRRSTAVLTDSRALVAAARRASDRGAAPRLPALDRRDAPGDDGDRLSGQGRTARPVDRGADDRTRQRSPARRDEEEGLDAARTHPSGTLTRRVGRAGEQATR